MILIRVTVMRRRRQIAVELSGAIDRHPDDLSLAWMLHASKR